MLKSLYKYVDPSGQVMTVCKGCLPKNLKEAVRVKPKDPCTCDRCFELYHPTLKSEWGKVKQLVKSQ